MTRYLSLLSSGASVTIRIWPWRPASAVGLVVAGAWFALAASGGDVRAITVASPVCLGLVAFFMAGGIVPLVREDAGEDADEDASWARRHPWSFSFWPALATAAIVLPVRRLLALWNLNESVLSSVLDGLGRGAAVLVCVALAAFLTRRFR